MFDKVQTLQVYTAGCSCWNDTVVLVVMLIDTNGLLVCSDTLITSQYFAVRSIAISVTVGPIANLKGHYFQPSLSVCVSVSVSLTSTSTLQR